MESRNITLTLEKAQEFYNSNNEALRKVALQAFTENELTVHKFTNIKTFEDACKALNLDITDVKIDIQYIKDSYFEVNVSNHLIAIYKLDVIRKALNKDWKPSLIKGDVYYPYIRFYPAGLDALKAISNNNWVLGKSFVADGKKYILVGGDYTYYSCDGLACFNEEFGTVLPYLGFLGCKSKEVAEHMSRYFSKEIFEATYAQHIGIYEWV